MLLLVVVLSAGTSTAGGCTNITAAPAETLPALQRRWRAVNGCRRVDLGGRSLALESNSAQTYASIQFASSDPGLALNFSLETSSPLWKLGWQRIPEEQIGPPPQLKTDDAATCSAKLLNNTDFQGNDLRRGRSITVAGCCGECYAAPGCNAFSVWLDSAHPSGAECFLKRNANGKRTISDHVSATIVNPLPPPPPPPPPIPPALKNETDCLLRSLFVEYAASVNPNIGAKEGRQMADALEGDPLMGAGCTVAVKLPPPAPPTPPPPPPAGHEVFVDGVHGRDTAAGTEAAPLRTLAQAVAVLRGSAAAGAKIISLRAVGGDSVLHLNETLRLTAADSHLTLRTAPADAAAGHRAYLSGATPLVGQQWTRVGSTHQNLWSTQLKDVHEVASMRIGGGRYWRARFPNGNPETSFPFKVGLSANHWLQSRPTHGKTRTISEPTSTNRNDTVGRDKSYSVKTGGNSCARYTPPESHYCNGDNDAGGGCVVNDTTLPHAPYKNATGAVITGMHGGMWCSFMYRVASATHAAGVTTFTFDEIGGQQCNRPEGSHGQILVENVEEELDSPSEFWFDEDSRTLTLWHNASVGNPPPTDGSLQAVTTLAVLINATGSQAAPIVGLHIQDLGFRDTAPAAFLPHVAPTGGQSPVAYIIRLVWPARIYYNINLIYYTVG
jgi:hypothetical protein